ncbi:unnamed protein product, partial [Porites lobata]
SDDSDKVSLVERVFQTRLVSSARCIVSLQRFDPEWEDLVDIDIAQIRDRDKIKVVTIDNSQTSMAGETSTASLDSHDHGVEQLIQNLQEERTGLDYNLSIAQATLESLKVAPRERGLAGKHTNFTCSSCHYKGHRVNNCMLHPCRGYYECGQLSLHREHRDHLKQILVLFFARERTRTNFFAVTRKKLQCHNPIKYSNRTTLDNDLRILATACNHRVPSDTADLEQIIENYRNKASRVKSVQNHVSHDYNRTVYQKQNLNQCKSPITINNQWAPFSMPHSPPYYETQSPPPYMHHRTPSPTRLNEHDHPSKKRLKYTNQAHKEPGKKFRESLKSVAETKTVTTIGSGDETQDDSPVESPGPKTSSAEAEASVVKSSDECFSQSIIEESFNYDEWVKKQIAITKEISKSE